VLLPPLSSLVPGQDNRDSKDSDTSEISEDHTDILEYSTIAATDWSLEENKQ
jgi:hypothetical protein